jgi:asparagine synthase (glutamine-hydrolysing)
LISYLTFGSLYDPNTLVEGVRALPPGHFLNWKEGRITLGEYCDVIDPTITASAALANDGGAKSREQLENEVAQVLEESVRMQLVSDVPVGDPARSR